MGEMILGESEYPVLSEGSASAFNHSALPLTSLLLLAA